MKPKPQVIRKIIDHFGQADCRAITLPRNWLTHVEAITGKRPTHVRLTLDTILTAEVLRIEPLFNPDPSLLRKRYSLGRSDKHE